MSFTFDNSSVCRPRRSLLFMPGSNKRALDKAKKLPADVLIFDLEDAVSPEEKGLAREQVIEALKSRAYGHRERVVRINHIASREGLDDLTVLVNAVQTRCCCQKLKVKSKLHRRLRWHRSSVRLKISPSGQRLKRRKVC